MTAMINCQFGKFDAPFAPLRSHPKVPCNPEEDKARLTRRRALGGRRPSCPLTPVKEASAIDALEATSVTTS